MNKGEYVRQTQYTLYRHLSHPTQHHPLLHAPRHNVPLTTVSDDIGLRCEILIHQIFRRTAPQIRVILPRKLSSRPCPQLGDETLIRVPTAGQIVKSGIAMTICHANQLGPQLVNDTPANGVLAVEFIGDVCWTAVTVVIQRMVLLPIRIVLYARERPSFELCVM
jgi:hypothetical protein